MDTRLTPTELDALLEAARAATPGPWLVEHNIDKRSGLLIRAPKSARPSIPNPAVCRVYDVLKERQANAVLIALANPTTIKRLVLMVRELQEQYAPCAQVQKRGEHSSWTCQCIIAVEDVLKCDAVEHFRARAVRASVALAEHVAQELAEQCNNPLGDICNYDDYRKGQIQAAVELKESIESLPLVETEE